MVEKEKGSRKSNAKAQVSWSWQVAKRLRSESESEFSCFLKELNLPFVISSGIFLVNLMWEEGVWRIYFTIQPQSLNTSYIHPSNIFQQRTIWNENRQVRRASRVLCWAGKVEAEWNWTWASFSKLTQNILTVARARLAESWEGGCLRTSKIAPVPFSLPLSSMVQTNLVNWNLIPAISKTSSKNVIIVRSPKHIRAWVELAGWQNASQSRDALETKDWSKQWNLVGGVEEVLSRWLNGKPAICCCWSSGLWAGLAQLKPPPRYWTATLVAPFNPAVFLSTQPSTLHRSQTHISQRKSFHDTWLSTIQATLSVESLNMEEIPPLPRTV